jgi:lipoate-protein ligase A
MSKKITLSEEQLTKVIKNILEQDLNGDETLFNIDDIDLDTESTEEDENKLSDLEDEIEQILSPEEIMALMEEQIVQLQDRTQYMEELNADMLEFVEYLMGDLEKNESLELRKSRQKLRALEGRAGREIFWLKSRRL